MLGDHVQVWRALKGLTGGFARSVVQSVHGEDGFEAWRQLHLQFEPKLMVRQGQVLAAMVTRPAKTVNETRELTMEIYCKLKEIRDLTEENVSDTHAKTVFTGFLEPKTKQHTAYRQGDTFEALKHAVVEFTNAIGTSTAMDDIFSEPMQ